MKKIALVLLVAIALFIGWLAWFFQPDPLMAGGEGSVGYKPFASYSEPVANLSQDSLPDFHAGRALAHQPWVKAPTITTGRDGLGPIYNARMCLACHANGGRGKLPDAPDQPLFSTLVRLSLPGFDAKHGVIAEPTYGDQLQMQSVALAHQLRLEDFNGEVKPEARGFVEWQTQIFTYPDGEQIELRKPKLILKQMGYGEFAEGTQIGFRNAQPLLGVGLLQAIDQKDIDRLADPEDKNQDGISGRVNQVWDFEQQTTRAGRFGWKANQPSVRQQVGAAFRNDVGITNPVFPAQPCTEAQTTCLNTPDGNDGEENLEIPSNSFALVDDFTHHLAVPKARPAAADKSLQRLFKQTGCADCHYPSFKTGELKRYPALSNQVIFPYTDLLLHDMGEGLADGRSDYLASGSEWRTAPLWGVGLSKQVNGSSDLLHDGRARNIEEAILWHGGEAETAKQAFITMPKAQRQKLIKFVESL